jgi:anti-sigma B factor antagonist
MERNEILIVINLSQVPFIDSKGLEALLDYHNKIRKRGGSIKIANPNPLCNEIFNITNMTTYFEIYFDLERAGKSFL